MNPTFPAPDDKAPEQPDESPQIADSSSEIRDASEESDPLVDLEPMAERETPEASPGWVVSSSPATRSSSLNSKRSDGSGLSKIIPPVLGGLAAVPIAIAILWYGFGKDLGNTGPTVARYIPAIVPKHLRGGPFRDDGTLGGYGSYDPEESDDPFPPTPRVSTGPASELPILSDSNAVSSSAEPIPEKPSTTDSIEKQPEQPAAPDLTPAAKPTIKDAILQSEQIQTKLKESWSAADGEQRQAMAREFYMACLNLANQVAGQNGISLQAWKRDLDGWGREFMSEPAFPRLLGLCLDGKIEGLPPHQSGDAILFLEELRKPETGSTDWQFVTRLTVNGEKVTLQVPEAVHRKYLAQATQEPKQSLIIGVWQKNDSQAPWIEAVYVYW